MGVSGCAGWGGGPAGGGPDTINVLMVNNPQMVELQQLTEENFTAETGITVNFTVLPENDVRDKISQEFSSQAGQYDVATVSNFEIPIYAQAKWLSPLDGFLAKDPTFDQDDILKPMQVSLSHEGKVDGAEPGMAGICLRGQPGWGQVFAPLTTVVNTFGGTWFEKDWTPKVNAPEFKEAVNFYVNLVREHGENGAPQAGFTECLNNLTQGNAAMWYDATSAAGSLEADDSPVKGKMGYVAAPVEKTRSSGWLYAWSWSIQQASEKKDNAWKFISWASSAEYERLVGEQVGWSSVPAGKRASTYENQDYLQVAAAFAEPTRDAIAGADPRNPGVQPRPAIGIQFVDIPEFTDLGTQVSQYVSSAIAGQTTVDEALEKGQQLAEDVAERYQIGRASCRERV